MTISRVLRVRVLRLRVRVNAQGQGASGHGTQGAQGAKGAQSQVLRVPRVLRVKVPGSGHAARRPGQVRPRSRCLRVGAHRVSSGCSDSIS
jgi:hypothetical protein